MPAIISITTACKCTYCVYVVHACVCVCVCICMYRCIRFHIIHVLIYSDFRQNAKRITEYNQRDNVTRLC